MLQREAAARLVLTHRTGLKLLGSQDDDAWIWSGVALLVPWSAASDTLLSSARVRTAVVIFHVSVSGFARRLNAGNERSARSAGHRGVRHRRHEEADQGDPGVIPRT